LKISFELIPSSDKYISEQIDFIKKNKKIFNAINIPDILKLKKRSWDIDNNKRIKDIEYIPHLRAIDFNLEDSKIDTILKDSYLTKILIIKGDASSDFSSKTYDTSTLDLIKYIKSNYPEIIIYAGFDPYRSSLKEEIFYMNEKLEAGADFLMSQPFFDLNLIKVFTNQIDPQKLFLGISPVLTEGSKNYWENINDVSFPSNFSIDLDYNVSLANDIIELAQDINSNIYFMPIRVDFEKYFENIKIKGVTCS